MFIEKTPWVLMSVKFSVSLFIYWTIPMYQILLKWYFPLVSLSWVKRHSFISCLVIKPLLESLESTFKIYSLKLSFILKASYRKMEISSKPTISDKNYWDSLYFHEKVLKNVRLTQRYSKFPLPMAQCCTKSEKAMPDSGGLEWPRKLATNIE